MSFARPELLPLVLLLPILAAAGVYGWIRRRRAVARRLGEPSLVRRLGLAEPGRPETRRTALIALAAAALGIAAAGPQWGVRSVEGRTSAMDVVLAVDLSNSMLADDVTPDRLEQARLFAQRMLREMPGDRIGLVAFAGRAYVLSPLTTDHGALRLYIDAFDPGILSRGGSSLAAALRQSTDVLRGGERTGADRAIVLVSDGEALEDEEPVRAAAERAGRDGIVVHAVGIGTEAGARVPDRDPSSGRQEGYMRQPNGEIVISRLNSPLMTAVAERAGGEFVRLDSPGAVDRIVDGLRRMERAATAEGGGVEPHERYTWFVGLALVLLAIDAALAGILTGGKASTRPSSELRTRTKEA